MPVSTPEELRLGQINLRFLIDGPATGSSLTMFEFEVVTGARVPIAHSHDAYDETIYGLDGTLTMTLLSADGTPEMHQLTPGTSLFIPRGVPHRFDNLHSTLSRSLAVITPRHPRSAVLPRDGCCHTFVHGGEHPTRPSCPQQDHAQPRPDTDASARESRTLN